MSSGYLEAKFQCENCNSDTLVVPDNPTDESPVTCKVCGAYKGRFADLKEQIEKHLQDGLRAAFKNVEGFRIDDD